nr:MAG TPA: hypothetical protein [Caudoviricetes sp.]
MLNRDEIKGYIVYLLYGLVMDNQQHRVTMFND